MFGRGWQPAVALVGALLFAAPTLGATQHLNNHCSGAESWSNSTCWNGGSGPAPTSGDDVALDPGGDATTAYDLSSLVQLHSITLNAFSSPDKWAILTDSSLPSDPIYLQSGATVTDQNSAVPVGLVDDIVPGIHVSGPTSFVVGSNGALLSLDGTISGTGPVTFTNNSSSKRIDLYGFSTYTGGTTVSSPSNPVLFAANGAAPTGGAVDVEGKALFPQDSAIGSLAGGGNVLVGSVQTLTVGGDNTDTEFAGEIDGISGPGAALTKIGTGTFTLSGASNSYAGNTTVNAGTLNLTGNIDSAVIVNSGATLAGTGTTSRFIVAEPGSSIAPGASVGALHVGGATLKLGSNFSVELGAGGGDDLETTAPVLIDSATLKVSRLNGYAYTPGAVYTIISNRTTAPIRGTFAGLPEGATLTVGGDTFRISYSGGSGYDVTLTAVTPDPRCGRLNAKLKRQHRRLAKASTSRKRAFIRHNIGQTHTRLRALGCSA
jgi:autotransporter-associated beta strand protein